MGVSRSGPLDVNLATALSSTTDSIVAVGDVAHDAADSGNPTKIGGKATGSPPAAVTEGDRTNASFDTRGNQRVALSGSGVDISVAQYAGDALATGAYMLPVASHLKVLNGADTSKQDRFRNNEDGTILASAARTATTSTADLPNYNGRGARCVLNVTVEGAATLSLKLQGKDSISGNYYDLVDFGVVYTAASDAPPTTRAYFVGPGVITADLIGVAGATGATGKAGFVPRTYRWTLTPADATSTTYSLSGGAML